MPNASVYPFAVSTTVRDSASELVDALSVDIAYEFGTIHNTGMEFSVGTGANMTDDGVYVMAEMTNDGVFEIKATPVETESNIGIVVMVETRDGNGLGSSDRNFAFYCTRLYSSCVLCLLYTSPSPRDS